MITAYLMCDMIPSGLCVGYDDEKRWECFDCGQELSTAEGAQSGFCELGLPYTPARKQMTREELLGQTVGRVCYSCADLRSHALLEVSFLHGRAFGAYFRLPKTGHWLSDRQTPETYGGIRAVCDGRGDALFHNVEVLSHQRLASGDVRRHLRAVDTMGRAWHGWERDGYVSFRPYKHTRFNRPISE